MKKRLFISIGLPKEAQDRLAALQDRQRYALRWVEPSQFHMTVVFLGDVEEELLVHISDVLSALAKQETSFEMTLDHVGLFPPKIVRPNMVWAFFKDTDNYDGLVHATKEALMKADASFMRLSEEWRKDIPHVTLARFRGSEFPRTFDAIEPFTFRVDRIELMESVLYPEGPLYSSLETFTFSS